jgi:hypothetical protein
MSPALLSQHRAHLVELIARVTPLTAEVSPVVIQAGIAHIANETGLTRQTVYRIKGDPAGADQRNGVILGHVLGARNGDTAAVSRGAAAGLVASSKSLQQTRRGVVG